MSLEISDVVWLLHELKQHHDFAMSPQGKSLLNQIARAPSTWKRDGLKEVYQQARLYFESQTDREPGQHADDSIPGHEENEMTLEQLIAANTAALEANTAALLKAGGSTGTATAGTTKPNKTKEDKVKDEPTSKNTREELAVIMGKVKDAKTAPVAKALIKEHGGADKLADVAVDKIDALFDAATKLLEADDDM